MRRLAWGFTLLLAAGPAVADQDVKQAPADQVKSLIDAYEKGEQEFFASLTAAKSPDERAQAQQKRPKPEPVAARLLELAEQNPNDAGVTPGALIHVLTLRMRGAGRTKLRDRVLVRLTRDYAASDQLGPILMPLSSDPSLTGETFLRAVADKNPNDEWKGKATFSLAVMFRRGGRPRPPDARAAGLRQGHRGRAGQETAQRLRDADPDRLDKDAEMLFETVANKYAQVRMRGDVTLGDLAKGELFEIRNLAIGKMAPEIEGEDLDGKPFKLSDYRGKVVVLDFWGHW